MFLLFMLVGSVLSTPTDEFKEFTKNGVEDILKKSEKFNIVPSGLFSSDLQSRYTATDEEWADLIRLNPNNKYFKLFNNHIEKGITSKGLTFCIYDDNMREAAIALFRLFQTTEGETFANLIEWAKNNINKEMFMYALRLEAIYSSKTKESNLVPPFIWNPHYFVNSESLEKASLIASDISTNGRLDDQMAKVDQYSYASPSMKEFVIINSNYSAWNLPIKERGNDINYFREDVALNSYYLGLHLLHPFWMTNEELEYNNPRFAEHYYYAHQQLMARYNLEKLHIKTENVSFSSDGWDYVPYLRYKNGLPFPTRSCIRGNWDTEKAYLKNIDIGIRECISRGLIIMQNGERLTLTDDSHIEILAKLIRANLDGIKVAKIARSIVGYGGHTYPINEYNPAPSILHHPETSLRDPVYWIMIQHMLNYFADYKNTMQPFNLSQYESDEFKIIDSDFSKITTYFDYYKFSVNLATTNNIRDEDDWISHVAVRQRRLTRVMFSLNFTVESTVDKESIVRLYLGPECSSNCWDLYNQFYELDTFRFTLQEGINVISWCPEKSDRLSFDDDYNTVLPRASSTKYSMFKFPGNLLIPRGLEEGLNLTMFIIITTADDDMVPYPQSFYRGVSNELDSKPLGFPFHRQAKGFKDTAPNYKFYNISIYHKHQPVDYKGYFSPHLY